MSYNRMTIREVNGQFQVFRMKPQHRHAGSVSGGGHRVTYWFVSGAARAQFTGSYDACAKFITESGAQYMSEHAIGVLS